MKNLQHPLKSINLNKASISSNFPWTHRWHLAKAALAGLSVTRHMALAQNTSATTIAQVVLMINILIMGKRGDLLAKFPAPAVKAGECTKDHALHLPQQ